ncbi:insulinase family protein [Pajaroellobacter abortibovis]|uniref:Peptidase M16 C-terminal domain-containing protein n=1 Tax=Pajaroellobacter abortibovis TaxID=1882918 RepID=A0A1L6MXS5_9BACT|nr:insulinase family protein [Pajaroellobacter abortibovis]APS00198.1 hypothetical protein BCY86_05515 [Pajaroellobacter abortibovis]
MSYGLIFVLFRCSFPSLPNSHFSSLLKENSREKSPIEVQTFSKIPPLVTIEREGDPQAAIGLAVVTLGIDSQRDTEVAIALSSLLETRLQRNGMTNITVIPMVDGYRIHRFIQNAEEGEKIISLLHQALLSPIAQGSEQLTALHQQMEWLQKQPSLLPSLSAMARCEGKPYLLHPNQDASSRNSSSFLKPNPSTIESWRTHAHTVGRIAFGITGTASTIQRVSKALISTGAWPEAQQLSIFTQSPPPMPTQPVLSYSIDPSVQNQARVTLASWIYSGSKAVAIANHIVHQQNSFIARLNANCPLFSIQQVTATAHPEGGCLVVTMNSPLFPPSTKEEEVPFNSALNTLSAWTAIAEQELQITLNTEFTDLFSIPNIVLTTSDPREASSLGAWWALASQTNQRYPTASPSIGISLEIPSTAEIKSSQNPSEKNQNFLKNWARNTIALATPQIAFKTKVEQGQGEIWILLASPCGTLHESDETAGLTAMATQFVAEYASTRFRSKEVTIEEWISTEGVGWIAHTPRQPLESSHQHAQRIADALGQSLFAIPLDSLTMAQTRIAILARRDKDFKKEIGIPLAKSLAPGRLAWLFPFGSPSVQERISDAALRASISSLQQGPLRASILVNQEDGQAQEIARLLDRWANHDLDTQRHCHATPPAVAPRPGSYAIRLPSGSSAEAWIAFPLSPNHPGQQEIAQLIAILLNQEEGIFSQTLRKSRIIHQWGARVIGSSLSSALAIRMETSPGQLESAVDQARAILQRLRQGDITQEELSQAIHRYQESNLEKLVHPSERLIALWRNDPPFSLYTHSMQTFLKAITPFLSEANMIVLLARPTPPSL